MFYLNLTFYIVAISLLVHTQLYEPVAAHPLVSECPGQSVQSLRQEAEHFEISLLFYYVSWSSEARQARLIYDGIAHYYYDEVYFAALNCYHLQCNCSRTHQTAHGSGAPSIWPTLVVNYGRNIVFKYNGRWQFEYLTRFMNNLIKPLDRVRSVHELRSLILESDAVVLLVCANARTVAYKRYVAAAIKWLEYDPERNLRFAIIFGENSLQQLQLETNTTLPLLVMLDSRSKVHTFNWKATTTLTTVEVISWVQFNLKNMQQYLHGYSTPQLLAKKAQKNAVLVLNINAQPIGQDFYSIMAEKMDKRKSQHKQVFAQCEQYWLKEDGHYHSLNEIQQHFDLMNELGSPEQAGEEEVCHQRLFSLNRHTLSNYYRFNDALNHFWSYHAHLSDADLDDSPFAPKYLLMLQQRNHCLTHPHYVTPALKISIAKYITRLSQKIWQQTDNALRHNQTLTISLLDGSRHRSFLTEQGLPTDQQSSANVYIIDTPNEAIHVMDKPYSYMALLEFIYNYYMHNLTNYKRSSAVPMPTNAPTEYISNYNRDILLQALDQPNITNVVLLHSPACALSAVMAQSFVQVALLLRSPDLRFIRLDTSTNDLPWELDMPISPALLVFPKDKQSESRIFPIHLKADVQHIFEFILTQLEPETQLRLVLASCQRTRQVKSCLEFARNLAMQHIGQHLKYWEIYEAERDLILSKLSDFNDLHMEIQRSFS